MSTCAAMYEERSALTQVKIKNFKTGETKEVKCGAAFVAIGHDPNTKLLAGQVRRATAPEKDPNTKLLAGQPRKAIVSSSPQSCHVCSNSVADLSSMRTLEAFAARVRSND